MKITIKKDYRVTIEKEGNIVSLNRKEVESLIEMVQMENPPYPTIK